MDAWRATASRLLGALTAAAPSSKAAVVRGLAAPEEAGEGPGHVLRWPFSSAGRRAVCRRLSHTAQASAHIAFICISHDVPSV
jgi:hypothetical protein